MITNNIIEESVSPWSRPVVMAAMKDGSSRVCIDFRKLNEKTIKDSFPLPRIDEYWNNWAELITLLP